MIKQGWKRVNKIQGISGDGIPLVTDIDGSRKFSVELNPIGSRWVIQVKLEKQAPLTLIYGIVDSKPSTRAVMKCLKEMWNSQELSTGYFNLSENEKSTLSEKVECLLKTYTTVNDLQRDVLHMNYNNLGFKFYGHFLNNKCIKCVRR